MVEKKETLQNERWISFMLNEQVYATPIDHIHEVILTTEIESVPSAPKKIVGVINLRGKIISVFDTSLLFGFEKRISNHIIIVQIEKDYAGFLVDQLKGVLNIPKDKILQNNNYKESLFSTGLYAGLHQPVILIDFKKILNNKISWA